MIDIPWLFIAIAEWMACLLHMLAFKKRVKPVQFAALCVVWLAALIAQNVLFGYFADHWILECCSIVTSLILMIAFIFSGAEINLKDAIFYGFSSCIVAGFISAVHWQLFYYIYLDYAFAAELWFRCLWLAVIYSACFVLILICNDRIFKNSKVPHATVKDIIFIFVLTVFCIFIANIKIVGGAGEWTPGKIREWFEIRTLVYLCGMILLYCNRIILDKIMYMSELTATNQIMENQFRQYTIYKENDEAINRHYHDLKHQIDMILGEDSHEKRSEYLEEMSKAIKLRQSEKLTGNRVVDVILSGKSIACVNNGITLSVVADGCLLNFMSQMDICSVLGNSIDNAIEYVKSIEEPEKRIIQVALFQQGDMVVLRVKNYFSGRLNYKDEAIVTTKENKNDHGYGIKSIRLITEKYGGTMQVVAQDGWFTLCLLFPQDGDHTKFD